MDAFRNVYQSAIRTVPWKLHLWGWLSITANINYAVLENISSKTEQKTMFAHCQTCYTNLNEGTMNYLEEPAVSYSILMYSKNFIAMGRTLHACCTMHVQRQAYFLPESPTLTNPSNHVRLAFLCSDINSSHAYGQQ